MNHTIELSLKQLHSTWRGQEYGLFRRTAAIRKFLKEQPQASSELLQYYDAQHQGWYHWFDRITTSRKSKLAFVLNTSACASRWHAFMLKHRVVLLLLLGAQLFLSSLCPAHPLAIDAYLVASAIQKFALSSEARAARDALGPDPQLRAFLLSSEQVKKYRSELLRDARDSSSEVGFAITRNRAGVLNYIPVHSIHEHLGNYLPRVVREYLDRRFIFGFNERIDIWRRGDALVASGHYHVYGGPPSPDDLCVMKASTEPLIMVSNGFIPFVYFQGRLLEYGQADCYAPELDDWLKTVTAVLQYSDDYATMPDRVAGRRRIRSFLYFLREYEGVDINDATAVKEYLRTRTKSLQVAFASTSGHQSGEQQLSNFFEFDLVNFENYDKFMTNAEAHQRRQ